MIRILAISIRDGFILQTSVKIWRDTITAMTAYAVKPRAPREFHDSLPHLSEAARDILFSRGINDVASAAAFISPDYDAQTHDPFLMKDMDKVVARLWKARADKEKVAVFSDYDADGIPGAVIMHDFLKKIGIEGFEIYIPHRHDEGFGLNRGAIDSFKEKGVTLLITVDCGIADVEEVAYAKSLGIDVVITDHHLPPAIMPPAFAILNPKQEGCQYPEKMLCGSGVAFKLVQAFIKKYGKELEIVEGWEKWLLDMVGIATLSDMVPLTGENRVFAVYGLKVLRKTRRVGLSALFAKLRLKREYITEDDVGFTISPRINAASRMGVARDAFVLLSTENDIEAETYADHLDHINNERKGTVAALTKEIKKILAERDEPTRHVLVIGNPHWKPALLGLAANSFANDLNKPVFVWGKDADGTIKGSCRAGGSLSVVALMEKVAEVFIEFGGHAASGGFAVVPEHVHTLEDTLSKAFEELSTGPAAVVETLYDGSLSIDDVNWDLYKGLETLAPFGTGNAKPLFIFPKALIGEVKSFGKEKNHTEVIFKNSAGRDVSAIAFFKEPSAWAQLVKGSTVALAAHIEKSTFKRYPELRLRIVDIL
jgi:single-stranded-DNA-specific exonuclease